MYQASSSSDESSHHSLTSSSTTQSSEKLPDRKGEAEFHPRSPPAGVASSSSLLEQPASDGSVVAGEDADNTDVDPASTIPASSLAGRRRGLSNVPPPLILRATAPNTSTVHDLRSPPLSAASASTASTGVSSEFSLRTPRSPYFHFDDPLNSPEPLTSPTSTSGTGISRTIRRLASRTQMLFSKKEKFLTPPPPLPMPISPTSPARLSPPSPTSAFASEWYDSPEDREPRPPLPSSSPSTADLDRARDRGVDAIPSSSTASARTRSDSVATVKYSRKQRDGRESRTREPRTHGKWNRNDIGEVIVGLRMLK